MKEHDELCPVASKPDDPHTWCNCSVIEAARADTISKLPDTFEAGFKAGYMAAKDETSETTREQMESFEKDWATQDEVEEA